MWRTDTIWLDLAVFMTLVLIGNILFGRFEEYRPRWRRLLKAFLAAVVFVAVTASFGRIWGYSLLVIPLIGALVVHAWWLPKHGINGWTGEPRDRYLELVRRKRRLI